MADVKRMTRKKLGELLLADGLVTREQIQQALEEQKKTGELLGEILVAMELVTERDIAATIARQFSIPYISTQNYEISEDIQRLLPIELLREANFVPLDKFGNVITIIIGGIIDHEILSMIELTTGCHVQLFVGTATEVHDSRMRLIQSLEEILAKAEEESQAVSAEDVQQEIQKQEREHGEASRSDDGGGRKPAQMELNADDIDDINDDWASMLDMADESIMKEIQGSQEDRPSR